MASELGINVKQAKRAGLLHDIGKAVDHETEGPHGRIGAELAKKYGESPIVVHAIASHHEEEKPESMIDVLVEAADALSGARPGGFGEDRTVFPWSGEILCHSSGKGNSYYGPA
jgi:ribonuclease Y